MAADETVKITGTGDLPAGLGGSCIVLIYGGNLGECHPVTGELRIGRSDSNTVVLHRPDVSRRHLRIYRKGLACFAEDLGSTNGSYVNDQRIDREIALKSGDLIRAGRVVFKYLDGSDVETLFHEEVYRLTITDGLTRLPNKRYLDEFLRREVARSQRHEHPLAAAMFDIDHFKRVNDSFGHPVGDRLLVEIGRQIRTQTRLENLFARYGGDEFALVMIEADLDAACRCCERMRQVIRAIEIETEDDDSGPARVTVSIGVASMLPPVDPGRLIRQADEALYEAKEMGGDRVIPVLSDPA